MIRNSLEGRQITSPFRQLPLSALMNLLKTEQTQDVFYLFLSSKHVTLICFLRNTEKARRSACEWQLKTVSINCWEHFKSLEPKTDTMQTKGFSHSRVRL